MAACHASPGAPDGSTDSPLASGGLIVAWDTHPVVGADGSDGSGGSRVDAASITLADLRVVGDAAPGDARTSKASVSLVWDGSTTPASIIFDQAPPGLYSQIDLRVVGLQVHGQVQGEGDVPIAVELDDSPSLAVSLSLSIDLVAEVEQTATVAIDLGRVLDEVDWESVPVQGGVHVLDAPGEQLDGAREAAAQAFTVSSP